MPTMQYSKVYPEAHVKAMEAIIAMPSGGKRWRATAALWVNLNQLQEDGLRAKEAYLQTAQAVADKRDSLVDKFAELKSTDTARDSTVRESLELPAGLWAFIKMYDKLAFERSNPDCKRNLKRLREEFPEFAVGAW